jgi:hypothetical protein
MTDEEVKAILDKDKSLTIDKLARWQEEAQPCKDEDALINHQKASNPFQSCYGDEDWMKKLKTSTMMSLYV